MPLTIVSGTRGVVLSTAYTFFDAGFNVYVIEEATIDPVKSTQAAIVGEDGILAKLPATIISLDDAISKL